MHQVGEALNTIIVLSRILLLSTACPPGRKKAAAGGHIKGLCKKNGTVGYSVNNSG
jgi:hypothetical protein